MEDKIVFKFINKIKDKLSKNKTTYPSVSEYAFSTEEIESMSRQNKQKIQELKQDIFSQNKKVEEKKLLLDEEFISPVEGKTIIEAGLDKEMIQEYQESTNKEEILEEKDIPKEELEIDKKNELTELKSKKLISEISEQEELNILEEESIEENNASEDITLQEKELPKNSFVHLNEEYQKIVMSKWKEIDPRQIDKDIIEGKDLFNHNYTITYADEAAKFIHNIRKRYEVVICYLIGFNNEKKGIYEKTIFSDKIENEWKYLGNYIKVLEKIRSFRK